MITDIKIDLALAVAGLVAVAFNWLPLGQAELFGPAVEIVGKFGGYGLAFWLVIHHTMITIPNMQKQHHESMTLQSKQLIDEMGKQREEYRLQLSQEREHFAKYMDRSCRYSEK